MLKTQGSHPLSVRSASNAARTLGRIAAVSSMLLIAACAGQQARLSPENRDSLSSESQIYAVHHKSLTGFTYESTGYVLAGVFFTPLVAIAQAGEGVGLVNELKLEDPVLRVEDRLVKTLQERFKVSNVSVAANPPKNDQVASIVQAYPTGVVLDVRTMKWGVDNARAIYKARARLIRSSSSTIVWQATCKFTADKDKPAPKMDDLKANSGILLKAKILDAADGCADQLVNWVTDQDR